MAKYVFSFLTSYILSSFVFIGSKHYTNIFLKVLGFAADEQETIFKLLASILHIGNVYFHRKQLKYGQEGVEVGSDLEIKWAAHLLQVTFATISRHRKYLLQF